MTTKALLTLAAFGITVNGSAWPHAKEKTINVEMLTVQEVPPLGLGTWLSDRKKVSHAVEYALKSGYRHIDAAYAYKNEDKVGEGIAASRIDRQDLWVTSKLWNTHHKPSVVRDAIDESIEKLGVEYLDLYLMHWPVAFEPEGKNRIDKGTSITDTWQAMEELVRANRTRYIGVSNFSPSDIQTILDICKICPYAHEFEAHPYLQQQGFVDWHLERGIKVISYSPLGNTNPTYDSNIPPLLKDSFWETLAEKKHATVAQAVLAWGLQRGTIVIPKSVHENHIKDNLKALDIKFSTEELRSIGERDKKKRMNDPGKSWGVALFKGLDDPTEIEEIGEL